MAGKGSKPGERRGGRQKGTPNKTTVALAEATAKRAAVADGEEFEVLKACWSDGSVPWPIRVKALEVSMQYRYAKLSASTTDVTAKVEVDAPSDGDLAKQLCHVLSVAAHKGQETRH